MRNRSVIEVMILVFTFIIAFFITGMGLLIVIVEARNPTADTGILANTLSSLVSGIMGALLGLIAGRAAGGTSLHQRPSGDSDGLEDPPPPPGADVGSPP